MRTTLLFFIVGCTGYITPAVRNHSNGVKEKGDGECLALFYLTLFANRERYQTGRARVTLGGGGCFTVEDARELAAKTFGTRPADVALSLKTIELPTSMSNSIIINNKIASSGKLILDSVRIKLSKPIVDTRLPFEIKWSETHRLHRT